MNDKFKLSQIEWSTAKTKQRLTFTDVYFNGHLMQTERTCRKINKLSIRRNERACEMKREKKRERDWRLNLHRNTDRFTKNAHAMLIRIQTPPNETIQHANRKFHSLFIGLSYESKSFRFSLLVSMRGITLNNFRTRYQLKWLTI